MESKRKFIKNESGFATPIEGAMVIISVISIMLIGAFFAGVLGRSLMTTMRADKTGASGGFVSGIGNASIKLMNNTSRIMDGTFGIVNVNLIIYILGGSLAIIFAIFASTRMRQG